MFARWKVLAIGLVIWAASTLVIRLAGQRLLQPGEVARTAVLYVVSFCAFALLMWWFSVGVENVTLLVFPTLILDSFSCLFFESVFPNIAPAAAGLFGGWMLVSCAGGIAGAWLRR
jgi:hypothetical protein